jgi:hypothetical protein
MRNWTAYDKSHFKCYEKSHDLTIVLLDDQQGAVISSPSADKLCRFLEYMDNCNIKKIYVRDGKYYCFLEPR